MGCCNSAATFIWPKLLRARIPAAIIRIPEITGIAEIPDMPANRPIGNVCIRNVWSRNVIGGNDIFSKNGNSITGVSKTTTAINLVSIVIRRNPSGRGGIVNGWRNNVSSGSGKKSGGGNGGNINAMNRKCGAAIMNSSGSGDIANGWSKDVTNTN